MDLLQVFTVACIYNLYKCLSEFCEVLIRLGQNRFLLMTLSAPETFQKELISQVEVRLFR